MSRVEFARKRPPTRVRHFEWTFDSGTRQELADSTEAHSVAAAIRHGSRRLHEACSISLLHHQFGEINDAQVLIVGANIGDVSVDPIRGHLEGAARRPGRCRECGPAAATPSRHSSTAPHRSERALATRSLTTRSRRKRGEYPNAVALRRLKTQNAASPSRANLFSAKSASFRRTQ